jgi:tetratricopeptide (TPR) repeat protein
MLALLWLYALLSISWSAEVRIESADQPLTILLDGVRLGNTPLVIDMAPGQHVLGARQVGQKTKAVHSTSSDDDILSSIFAEAEGEDRVETDIYVTDQGSAVVTFSWITRSADVAWSGVDEEADPVVDTGAGDARTRGDAYRKDKRFSEAIAAYREAIDLGASENELMRWILICERELGQEAVTAAKERGDSLCERGDSDGAVAAYEEAIEAGGSPSDFSALINECRQRQNEIDVVGVARERADDFVDRGQMKEAIETYREAIRLGGPTDELEEMIRELEMWQANLVVTIRGLDKRGELVAYLQSGESRIEPTSNANGVIHFQGVAAETDYRLFVGGEGYKSVEQQVEALAGRSTRELSLTLEYRGAMALHVSSWMTAATVRLEQPPLSMELESQTYSITAAPAEIVISAEFGTVRWPLDGDAGVEHRVHIPSMLPSAITIEGVPLGSKVYIVASPDDSANGPVFLSSNPKTHRDGAVEIMGSVEVTDLRGGSYGLRIDHPNLGSKLSRLDLVPGILQTLNFDWRSMPEGGRIAAAYSSWQAHSGGLPKAFWLGSGAGVISVGTYALMASNLATAKSNYNEYVDYQEVYQQQLDDWETEEAIATYDSMEVVRGKRNLGILFASLEGVVGTGSAVLSAWLLKTALSRMGGSKDFSLNDHDLDGASFVYTDATNGMITQTKSEGAR